MFLAASPERLEPVPDDLVAEGGERLDVVGHRVVLVVPSQGAGQPASLLINGQMLATLDLAPQDSELGRYPLRVSDPLELETPCPRLPADVREAKKPEPAPRGAMRKEMTDINISSVPAEMPAPG